MDVCECLSILPVFPKNLFLLKKIPKKYFCLYIFKWNLNFHPFFGIKCDESNRRHYHLEKFLQIYVFCVNIMLWIYMSHIYIYMADIYIYDSCDMKSISEGVSVWKTDNFVRSANDIILSCQLQIKKFCYVKTRPN